MRGKFIPKLFFGILILVPLFLFGVSWVVMSLWNYALVSALGLGTITLWQAMAILVLSKILFSGFKTRPKHHSSSHLQKWKNMTPEHREELKERWSQYCEKRKREY